MIIDRLDAWWCRVLDERARRRMVRALRAEQKLLRDQLAYCDRQYHAATGQHIPDLDDRREHT
ncbi:hypothetical protein [Actinomadura rupiterrae]|uniref:hypothetical protein n=1 Tax=Actinomadura rupiterrae TaxID=559627 RepID=UPI0020A532E5|nr:hypothetical protein [Actinomadura rupiterrae]MCP2339202.1 transcriptional regulator of met regulon [Actinomadura rupiterrae]